MSRFILNSKLRAMVIGFVGFFAGLAVAHYWNAVQTPAPNMFFTYYQQLHTRELFHQAVAAEEAEHGDFAAAPQLILWPAHGSQADCVYVNPTLAGSQDEQIVQSLAQQLRGIRTQQELGLDPHPIATSVPDPNITPVSNTQTAGEGYDR